MVETKNSYQKFFIFFCRNYKRNMGINVVLKHLFIIRKNEQHQNTTWPFKYCWCWLKRIRKYYGKKTEGITEEEKQKYKAYFKGKEGAFVIEKLARDIIERCKLPEAIELRKKLGYNHDDIMVWEETSIAEKIIKIFPNENIVLKKNLITENQIFGLKIKILLMKLMKEIMKIMSHDEKERKDMFKKKHNFKIFWCNPNDSNFDLFKFVGKINLHISKLRQKLQQMKWLIKLVKTLKK